jgi:CubicO group peptidase (beta-lactamase class C family)
MTKPITGMAVLMLQDEGKLNVADPGAKYQPEFAALKTPSGKPANLTITQILTHTSDLGEASGPEEEATASFSVSTGVMGGEAKNARFHRNRDGWSRSQGLPFRDAMRENGSMSRRNTPA